MLCTLLLLLGGDPFCTAVSVGVVLFMDEWAPSLARTLPWERRWGEGERDRGRESRERERWSESRERERERERVLNSICDRKNKGKNQRQR